MSLLFVPCFLSKVPETSLMLWVADFERPEDLRNLGNGWRSLSYKVEHLWVPGKSWQRADSVHSQGA